MALLVTRFIDLINESEPSQQLLYVQSLNRALEKWVELDNGAHYINWKKNNPDLEVNYFTVPPRKKIK